ncbi:MAG: 2Fe-2S iron-sulfur cluster-binding protein [Sulfuritalea sp.]|nr:2Fe-2S iron-sulfur cluster-binding protein [Sulfuritalea sp.]
MKIQVNAKNRTYSFDGNDKEALLYSALRSGVDIPYECATGTCGSCKARLVEGKVHNPWPEAPGQKYLKAEQGEFLMCQCIPRTDLCIEVGNFVYPANPGANLPETFFGVIRKSRLLTRDVMLLEIEPDKPQDFDAGQFVGLRVPGISGYRAYSMVNFTRAAKALQFVIKKKPGGGCSEWLFNPENRIEGTTVDLVGPLGRSTFLPNIARNILCIAGGSGIAGMMSILARGAQERYFDHYKGYVFFGVRTIEDAFFLDELSGFKNQFPDSLKVVVALSDQEVPESARDRFPDLEFDRGFVHEVAARHMKSNYQNVRAYLAGPPPSVDAAIRTLIVEAKLSADNIVYDKFS